MSRSVAALLYAVSFVGCQALDSVTRMTQLENPERTIAGINRAGEVASIFQNVEDAGPGPAVTGPGPGVMSTLPPELPNADSSRHPEAGRLQVYSGNCQVSTTDIESSANRLIAMVKEKNGYLQSRTDALVVCRVPAEHFQTTVDRLEDCGTVVSQSVQTDDVTDEYRGFGLRLVMSSSRQRLVALMG